MLIYIKLNEFFVGIKLRANLAIYKEQFNIKETFMVGKLVFWKDEIGTDLRILFNCQHFVVVFLLFKMGSLKMLVKSHQVLLKSIGLVYFQRKLQVIGFIWKMSLKYEVRKKRSEGDKNQILQGVICLFLFYLFLIKKKIYLYC